MSDQCFHPYARWVCDHARPQILRADGEVEPFYVRFSATGLALLPTYAVTSETPGGLGGDTLQLAKATR
jgi:hypothetical protein